MKSTSNIRIKFDTLIDTALAEFIQKQFTFYISIDEIKNLYGITTNYNGKFYRGSASIDSFNYWDTLPVLTITEYVDYINNQKRTNK